MPYPPAPVFTRRADGSVTADHLPEQFLMSTEFLETGFNPECARVTEVEILGVRYRVGPRVSAQARLMERVK